MPWAASQTAGSVIYFPLSHCQSNFASNENDSGITLPLLSIILYLAHLVVIKSQDSGQGCQMLDSEHLATKHMALNLLTSRGMSITPGSSKQR